MKSSLVGAVKKLSYADPLILASLIVALASSAYVAYSAYSAASYYAYVEPRYVSDEIYYVDVARRLLDSLLNIDIEYWSYSGKTKDDYYNLEHPPLGKLIISASMLLCGDNPLCWRMPSIVEGALTPLILWAGYLAALRGRAGALAGAVASMAVAGDPVFRVMSSVAMLDIHQAFFTALALALAANRRFRAAAVAAGLAAASKFSGVAAVFAVAAAAGSEGAGWRDKLGRLAEAAAIAAIAFSAPYAVLVGIMALAPGSPFEGSTVERVADATLYVASETIDGIRWHATSRPQGQPASNPIGWILNDNPFYLSYTPLPLPAVTNTLLHAAALSIAVAAFTIEAARGRRLWPGPGHMFLVMAYLTYLGVMIAGNRTLYSFYAAQLTPAMAAVMGEAAAAIYSSRGSR
jgi:predicted membrane-bound dolichyl-phosphate-mannose-protein mannosyltransferase